MSKRYPPELDPVYDKLIEDCADEITSRVDCEHLIARRIVIKVFARVKEFGDLHGWRIRGDC